MPIAGHLRSGNVASESNGTKGNQEVVDLDIGNNRQEVGGETKSGSNRLDPDLGAGDSSDQVQNNNHENALNRSAERAQIQGAGVVLFPSAQVEVSEGCDPNNKR